MISASSPDLDDQVRIPLPKPSETVSAVHDTARRLLVVYVGKWPVKVFPTDGTAKLGLRAADAAELEPILKRSAITELARGAPPAPGDADNDGIPDPLDLLIGAHKTALNRATYGAGYIRMEFPMGDVPRDVGVCTDVVIRAVRNAGVDLQAELSRDLKRSRRSYPMVKRPNTHIDHRRVKTLLPYFVRRWNKRSANLADSTDPLRPGDVVFMDTFPSRRGPDHIGIISDRSGDSGHPLVINNWTDGSHTTELDLLDWVPVTHRFRFPVAP